MKWKAVPLASLNQAARNSPNGQERKFCGTKEASFRNNLTSLSIADPDTLEMLHLVQKHNVFVAVGTAAGLAWCDPGV